MRIANFRFFQRLIMICRLKAGMKLLLTKINGMAYAFRILCVFVILNIQ